MDKIIEYTVLKDKLAIRTNQILIDTNLKIEKLCKNERILIDQFFKITANNEVYFKKGVEDEIGINAIKNYYKCCDDKLSFFEKDYKDFDDEFKKMETDFDVIKDQCYTQFIYVDEDIFIQCLGSLLYKKLDKIMEFSSSEKTLKFSKFLWLKNLVKSSIN